MAECEFCCKPAACIITLSSSVVAVLTSRFACVDCANAAFGEFKGGPCSTTLSVQVLPPDREKITEVPHA
jgi:hypothetical protein